MNSGDLTPADSKQQHKHEHNDDNDGEHRVQVVGGKGYGILAAVTLPAPLGLLWLTSPGSVYGLAAALALVSLSLACLVPRHPVEGGETVLSPRAVAAE